MSKTQKNRKVIKAIVISADTPVCYLEEIREAYNDTLEIAMETIRGKKVIQLIAPNQKGLERLRNIFRHIVHVAAEEVPIYR